VDPEPAPAPQPSDLFHGPSTRERVLFHLVAGLGLFAAPVVWLVALLSWPTAGARSEETASRSRWLRRALLLSAFDVGLAALVVLAFAANPDLGSAGLPGGAPARPVVLGVAAADRGGRLIVEQAIPGTAAEEAGLKAGDTIVTIGGEEVDSPERLRAVVARHRQGDELELIFEREGKIEQRAVKLSPEPEFMDADREGAAALRRGDFARARREFMRALDVYPGPGRDVTALGGLAKVEEREGNLEAAAACLEEALGHRPPPAVRDRLLAAQVEVALRSGRPAEAAERLLRIEDKEISERYAPSVLSRQGKAEEAWTTWRGQTARLRTALFVLAVLAVLAVVCGARRPAPDGRRLFAFSAGVFLGVLILGHAVPAAYGWWAHGDPFAFRIPTLHPMDQALSATLAALLLLGLSLLAHRLARGARPMAFGWRLARPWRLPGIVLAALCLLYGVSLRIGFLALVARGFQSVGQHPLIELASEERQLGWWLLPSVCLLGPLAEEVFFRGFLHVHLRARLGAGGAVAGTALLFGLLHPVSVAYVVIASGLGLVLGYLRERYDSLIPPILAHAVFNGVAWTLVMTLR